MGMIVTTEGTKWPMTIYMGLTIICLGVAGAFWGEMWGTLLLLIWIGVNTKCYLMRIPELPHVIDPCTFTPYYAAYWVSPRFAVLVVLINVLLTKSIQLDNVDDAWKSLLRIFAWTIAVYSFVFLAQHLESIILAVQLAVVIEQSIFYGIRLYLGQTLPTGLIKGLVVVWPYYPLLNAAFPILAFPAFFA